MLSRTGNGRFLARLGAASLALGLVGPGIAWSQPPEVGTVQRIPVITISLQVGSTEKETRQVTYSPPPGWYVRSHRVSVTAKVGHSSYAVNTVPEDWSWLTEDKVQESYKALMELAGQGRGAQMQSKYARERDALLQELRQVRSAHHALVVEATARGEGFLRGGGRLDMTIVAELVYVGTEEALRQRVAHAQSLSASAGADGPKREQPSRGKEGCLTQQH